MVRLGNAPPDDRENKWRYQLDRFVKNHQEELAAIAWGLKIEWGDSTTDTLGIDLLPAPHFVCCGREDLEKLNQEVDYQVQEILGVLDGYDPTIEVAIVSIGLGQLKLIHYQPKIAPPDCFEKYGRDLNSLIAQVEQQMAEIISSVK